jgi:hypothetical protein
MFTQLLYRVDDLFAVSTVDWADIVDRPVVIGEAILYHHKRAGHPRWAILLRVKDVIQCVFESDHDDADRAYIKVVVEVEDIPYGHAYASSRITRVPAPTTGAQRLAIIEDGSWCDMWEF